MYRRYYQGYNQPNDLPQRPIGQGNEMKNEENIENSVSSGVDNISPETNTPEIVVPEKPFLAEHMERKPFPELPLTNPSTQDTANKITGIFGRFKKDDFILLALIAILLLDGSDDGILVVILIFLFFVGF